MCFILVFQYDPGFQDDPSELPFSESDEEQQHDTDGKPTWIFNSSKCFKYSGVEIVDLECRFPIHPPQNCVLRFWNYRQRNGKCSSVSSVGG